MTQSKDEEVEFDMTEELVFDPRGPGPNDDTITIDLSDTYGTTTTYWAGDSITDSTISDSDGTFTIDTNTLGGGVGLDWIYERHSLSISEVEKMCNEYPALEKTWRNFKSMYDMVKQDYEGKKKAGEIDDDIPF